MLNSNFIDNLVTVMKNKKLNRRDISEMTGISLPQLSTYISKTLIPTRAKKETICEALKIPYEIMENDTIKEVKFEGNYIPVQKRLAKNLPFYLNQAQMSIQTLSFKTGIYRETIASYIDQTRMPELPNIRKMANALGISVGTLLK